MQKVGVAILALACVVAVSAAELYAAEDVSEAQYNLARDGSAELNGDSPVRQAQRARRDERVSQSQSQSQSAVSLMETGAEVDKYHGANGPALNRLTGAAKTFHPNDQMCVMCQFLVQRVQLDMAHFNVLGGFVGAKTAGAGGKDNAAAGGDNAGAKAAAEESSFLEIASGFGADDASKDWEAEDAEDAAAMELAAKQELAESDGDWDAVAALEQKSHAVDQIAEQMAAEDAAVTGEDEEDESEGEEEEEEEDVEEDGEEFEEEADTEHAVEQQLAASSFAEANAEVITSGLTAVERREMAEVMAEVRDDRVAESVDKQLTEGMESTPVLVETGAAAGADDEGEAELGAAFEHELDLSADEKEDLVNSLHGADQETDSDFTTPTYNADGSAELFTSDSEVVEAQTEEEDMALLQVAEEEEAEGEAEDAEDAEADAAAEEELEGMADAVELVETASNPHAPRAYARTLHVADADAAQPVLAEMSGQHQSFSSNGGLAQVYTRQQMAADAMAARCAAKAKIVSRVKKCKRIENTTRRRCKVTTKKRVPAGCTKGTRAGVVGISNSPRRFRLADALHSRPRWNRWDPTVKPHPDPNRAKAREMWHHLMQMTYDRLEGYCSTRLPEQFTPFCRPLLRRFRVVAEGIRYGDRPNQICMRTRFCPRGSYVRRSPHNVFKHMKVGF